MDSWTLLRLFGICFSAYLLSPSLGFNIEMPTSVRAVEGSCVLVPCQTQKYSRVIWYKYQSSGWPVVYDEKNPSHVIGEFKGRTSVPGLPFEGSCTLRINNVRRDDGITLFPYINPESDRYYKPTVQIKTKPRLPPVISGPESPVKEGEVFSISCSIQHSCPPSPPSIQWRGVSVKTTEVSTERTDAGMWATVSTVRVTAVRSLHSKEVHCQNNDTSTWSKPFPLDISFLSIMLPNSSCSEIGRTLRCVCWVEAHPVAKVTWMLIDRTELPATVIPNITIKGNMISSQVELEGKLTEQGPLLCVANNSHSTETHQIILICLSARTHFAWKIVASVLGTLSLGGLCYLWHTRQRYSDHSGMAMNNVPSRKLDYAGPELIVPSRKSDHTGLELDRTIILRSHPMVLEPTESELIYANQRDLSLLDMESQTIYDNDSCLR